MINLMIYINPSGKFDEEAAYLSKIQVDNSLEIGWKPENILLVTNFNWEYRGIKSLALEDTFSHKYPGMYALTKIPVVNKLFENGTIIDDIYWFHDLDVFENETIGEHLSHIGMERQHDLAITDKGYSPKWSSGSFFFRKSAKDIFLSIEGIMETRKKDGYGMVMDDEGALMALMNEDPTVESRVIWMDRTYQLIQYRGNLWETAGRLRMPPVAVHFHPNPYFGNFKNVLSERLLKVFDKYGFK